MNFLQHIWKRLEQSAPEPVLQEVRGQHLSSVTGSELLALVRQARRFLARAGVSKGDRGALLANNGIQWVALDLAMMAEGMVVVPLYARLEPRELVVMIRDCSPSLVCCGDIALRNAAAASGPDAPLSCIFDEIFSGDVPIADGNEDPVPFTENDPVSIIYTSGTAGESKGAVLTAGNVNYMLGCTNARLDALMGKRLEPEAVFHYLPFCFAGSWILLLTCLSRNASLALSTDVYKLAQEMKLAAPHYLLNVPTILERIRARVDEQFRQAGGFTREFYADVKASWLRKQTGAASLLDRIWVTAGNATLFRRIRASLGPNLRALICGSAPLAVDTQLFFSMLGIPVLQVYGLTETTAICTMDEPQHVEPGYVGPAIPGVEMKLGNDNEILVRGPNIFAGYWNRPEATNAVLRDGWFHTGDQGEMNAAGNWRITGRLKDLIILNSGHNIAPEPIENLLLQHIPAAQQAMLVGNNRSYLAALVTGAISRKQLEVVVEFVNEQLPHYKKIRAFALLTEPFSLENGLLTTNGKLKREAIIAKYRDRIDNLYRKDASEAPVS